jgi:hypothetical protein
MIDTGGAARSRPTIISGAIASVYFVSSSNSCANKAEAYQRIGRRRRRGAVQWTSSLDQNVGLCFLRLMETRVESFRQPNTESVTGDWSTAIISVRGEKNEYMCCPRPCSRSKKTATMATTKNKKGKENGTDLFGQDATVKKHRC